MIYTFTAFAPSEHKMDLGWTYNHYMGLLPSDADWACFLDHDAMFTTRDWYSQLTALVESYPSAGCFTAMTNRIGNPIQVHNYQWRLLDGQENRVKAHFQILDAHHNDHDVRRHREIGKELFQREGLGVQELEQNQPMSGVVILTQKAVWKQVGFVSGFLGVDRQYHLDCLNRGFKVYLMRGIYVYHWYRGDGDVSHVAQFWK